MTATNRDADASPLAAALDRIGDRWSLLLVERLLDGPARFSDLRADLPAIAPNILTSRLRRLEHERLLRAAPYSVRPPRMDYSLTAEGRELAASLRLLADWGARRLAQGPGGHEPLRHSTCGTALEARWFCPTCGLTVPDAEAPEDRLV